MREVRGAFVELKPSYDAVIGEIFRNAGFRDAQMVGKLRFDGVGTSTACAAAQKIGNGNAERLARLDIVIARQVRIGEEEYAGSGRRGVRVIQLDRRASKQAPELHLEERETRGKARVAVTTAKSDSSRVPGRLHG